MILAAGATVTLAEETHEPSADLGECAGCFLAVVRNARTFAARLAPGPDRETLLGLLAEGEIAAIAAFGVALGDREGTEEDASSRDAFRVIDTAVRSAEKVLDSLEVKVRVRTSGRPVRVEGPVGGLSRALGVAIACAAVGEGRRGEVLVSYGERRGRLLSVVRAQGAGARGRLLSFSPAAAVAGWLAREGGAVRVGGGRPPREWWLERPLVPPPSPPGAVAAAPSLIPALAR